MLNPKPMLTAPIVGWIAMYIAIAPGFIALGFESASLLAPALAWIIAVVGAWLLSALTLPWSNPPFIAAAAIFGSSFANFVSALWRCKAATKFAETVWFHLGLGISAGLAFTGLFLLVSGWPVAVSTLLAGMTGATLFTMLRFWISGDDTAAN